jgi:hypothetical protein
MSKWWDELPPDTRQELELGEASYAALKRGETVERWLNIGKALARMQAEIMRVAQSANRGRRYNDVRQRLGLHEHLPHLCEIHKTTRSHAVWLAENWEPVNAWLHTLAVNARLQKNHPSTIKRGYEAHEMALTRGATATAKASADALKPPARQDNPIDIVRMFRSGVFPPGRSVSELADVVEAGLAFDTFKRFTAECIKRIERSERQDKIEAEASARGTTRAQKTEAHRRWRERKKAAGTEG